MKPQIIRYRKYRGFHNESFLDSLRHELSIQGRFPNKKGLDAFSTIDIEVFDKRAPKKKRLYNIIIDISLIMKFPRQS